MLDFLNDMYKVYKFIYIIYIENYFFLFFFSDISELYISKGKRWMKKGIFKITKEKQA